NIDLGSINVRNSSNVIRDRATSFNLRYKSANILTYKEKQAYAVKNPKDIHLPCLKMSSSFIVAKDDMLFAYPNIYNHYVSYYKNTYQHGGISLQEIIIPFIVLNPRN